MRVCIHQPVYFPWVGFFHKLSLSDIYIVYDDCQAIKQSWMNRVSIADKNGQFWLTVPLSFKFGDHVSVRELKINYESNWRIKHLKTAKLLYGKTPFFDDIYPHMEAVLSKKYTYLMDLNLDALSRFSKILNINLKWQFSSEFKINKKLTATEKLCEMVLNVKADTYVCGMGSDSYLDELTFARYGIYLHYQKYTPLPYTQLNTKEFTPGLSVLDTYSNIGAEGVRRLVQENLKQNIFNQKMGTEICMNMPTS